MLRTILIGLGLTAAVTLSVEAQQWSPEQQEVIDAERACYDTWVNALVEQRSWDAFLEGCTAGPWFFWNTGEGTLETDEQVRRWWEQIGFPRGDKPNWTAVKPLGVKVRGNVGLLFAYIKDSWENDLGELVENEYKAFAVLHKEEGTYRLIGGMYVPVSSRMGRTP